jgi:hypothetical protein
VPRKTPLGAVRRGVEADLREIALTGLPPVSAGLQEVARVLAGVLDDDGPTTAKVQAAKTLADVLAQLRGASGPVTGGDAVDRIRGARARRRGAAA